MPDTSCALSRFRIDSPYPDRALIMPCPHDANLLTPAYAGIGSELTAINQYTYHRLTLACSCPEVSKLTGSIAQVEMTHFLMLGEALGRLGARPVLSANTCCGCAPWSPEYICYGCDAAGMLRADIQGERAAIALYTQLASCVCDKTLSALLCRIAEDEKLHLALLTDAAAQLCIAV